MKRKGRMVLEAAYIVPGICLLLVYLVFFSLYVHDYAVCAHAALECGTKGVYPDARSNQQREQGTEAELEQKLEERLLWLSEQQAEVKVDPVHLIIKITGKGDFLPLEGFLLEQKVTRIQPCETIRRSKWLLDGRR